MRHAHDLIHRHDLRRICTALAVVATSLAVGALPAMSVSTALAAGKSKHHSKHVKCKKGFVLKHGRCVTYQTACYTECPATRS